MHDDNCQALRWKANSYTRAVSEYMQTFLRLVQGGFSLIKKPLERVPSVYTNSETAIAAPGSERRVGSPANPCVHAEP